MGLVGREVGEFVINVGDNVGGLEYKVMDGSSEHVSEAVERMIIVAISGRCVVSSSEHWSS